VSQGPNPVRTDALALLRGWQPSSPAQEALRREYVAHLEANDDGTSRSCRPDHLTASTLVLSADAQVALLTLHAKAGRWFQLGGHVEPGDATLAGAAWREASEESGMTGLLLDPEPVHLDTHPVPFCGGVPNTRHLDVRFLATAPADAAHLVSAESLALRWWPVGRLPSDEPSLRELVECGLRRLDQRLRDHGAGLRA
jgi:8-oxo-dGTP pyrophosphatase MutT (NUDIX family)